MNNSSNTDLAHLKYGNRLIHNESGSKMVAIEFVSLLIGLKYDLNGYELQLNCCESAISDSTSFFVQIPIPLDLAAKKMLDTIKAKFDLEFPIETKFNEQKQLMDIHLEKLCFIHCRGTSRFQTNASNKYVNPDCLIPTDLSSALSMIESHPKELKTQKILRILNNLIAYNSDMHNPFKFVKLEDYDNRFAEFIQQKQQISMNLKNEENPLFIPRQKNLDSFNEFDSQYPTNDSASQNLPSQSTLKKCIQAGLNSSKTETISISKRPGIFETSNQTKKQTRETPNIQEPHSDGSTELINSNKNGEVIELQGRFVGIHPSSFDSLESLSNCCLHLYFTGSVTSEKKAVMSEKNEISVELLLLSVDDILSLFGTMVSSSSSLYNVVFKFEMTIVVKCLKWNLNSKHYTIVCCLESTRSWKKLTADKLNDTVKYNSIIKKTSTQLKRTPMTEQTFKTFHELSFSDVTATANLIGFFVSCSFTHPNFISMVFTDFTRNSVSQKYLFDRFLLSFENRLSLDEGFRVMIFPREFRAFNDEIKTLYGSDIKDLIYQNSENISSKGIICKLSIKYKIYNGTANIIVTGCSPLKSCQTLTKEANCIRNLIFKNIKHTVDLEKLKYEHANFSIAFPLEMMNGSPIWNINDQDEGAMSLEASHSEETKVKTTAKVESLTSTFKILRLEYSNNHIRIMATKMEALEEFIPWSEMYNILIENKDEFQLLFSELYNEVTNNSSLNSKIEDGKMEFQLTIQKLPSPYFNFDCNFWSLANHAGLNALLQQLHS